MEYIIVLLFIFIIYCFYILDRNNRVYNFKIMLANMAYSYNMRRLDDGISLTSEDAFKWFCDKYSYDKLLLSFKPLKLECWYTEKELEEINR